MLKLTATFKCTKPLSIGKLQRFFRQREAKMLMESMTDNFQITGILLEHGRKTDETFAIDPVIPDFGRMIAKVYRTKKPNIVRVDFRLMLIPNNLIGTPIRDAAGTTYSSQMDGKFTARRKSAQRLAKISQEAITHHIYAGGLMNGKIPKYDGDLLPVGKWKGKII